MNDQVFQKLQRVEWDKELISQWKILWKTDNCFDNHTQINFCALAKMNAYNFDSFVKRPDYSKSTMSRDAIAGYILSRSYDSLIHISQNARILLAHPSQRVNDFKDLFTSLRLQPHPSRPLNDPFIDDLARGFQPTLFFEDPPSWCSAWFKRNQEMKTEIDLLFAFKRKEDPTLWSHDRCQSAYVLLPMLDTIPAAKYFVAAVKSGYQHL